MNLRHAIGCAIVLATLGCGQTVTRTMTMSPSAAAQLNPRVRVLSFEHGGEHHSASGVMTSTTTLRTDDGEQVDLYTDDEVTVKVTYSDGDEVSGEGLVRSEKMRTSLLVSGLSLLAGGAALAGAGAIVNSSCRPTEWSMFDCMGEGVAALTLWISAGVSGLVGLGLTIAGVTPHTWVDKTPVRSGRRVNLTPRVGHGLGGAMMEMSW